MNKLFRAFKCLIINNIRFIFIKIFHFNSFKFSFKNLISPSTIIDIQGKGKLTLGKMVRTKNNCSIEVRDDGIIEIGNNVFMNNNVQITAHKKLTIKENTYIGPNVVIVDHDHLFSKDGIKPKEFKCKEVNIGKNVWIGANVVILKGTRIGDNSIIGAGSIVSGEIDGSSIMIQKKEISIKNIE